MEMMFSLDSKAITQPHSKADDKHQTLAIQKSNNPSVIS
jgi:hypothetical protein